MTSPTTFGLPFYRGTKEEVRKEILSFVSPGSSEPRGASVVFANAHVVVEATENKDLYDTLLQADLIVPDGVPIAWVMKALGHEKAQRYSGPDLMVDLFTETKNLRHFFLGSSLEVLEKIKGRFTGHAVGYYAPPFAETFDEAEKIKQLKIIEEARPDFIWVGLGAPKQERYVVEMAQRASRGIWLAVGAAFDFYAGTKPRAPVQIQQMGLEWAYRMFTEPRRLTIRYAKTNPKFIKMAFQELTRGRKGRERAP